VTEEELAALRTESDRGVESPELSALIRSAERAKAIGADGLWRNPPGLNLFVLNAALLDVALAAYVTADPTYTELLSALLGGFIVDGGRPELFPDEVHTGFMLNAVVAAIDVAGGTLDHELVSRSLDRLSDLAEALFRTSSRAEWGRPVPKRLAWNHAIIAFSGLGCAGIALDGHAQAAAWRDIALDRSLGFLEHGVTEAGLTREGLAYCGMVFRNLGLFLRGLRCAGAFDYVDGDQNPYLERLARVPRWYAGELFPGGRWLQNWNASHWEPKRAMGGFLMTFAPLDPHTTRRVWDRTLGSAGDGTYGFENSLAKSTAFEAALWRPSASGSPVLEDRWLHCADSGYVRDWVGDTGFSFTCGEFIGGIWDQSDNNSLTLFAEGVPVLIDSGGFGRGAGEGNPASSYGHNSVIIDGKGQWPAGGGAGVSGEIVHLSRAADHTIVCGDATRSYNAAGYNVVRHAYRWCVFVKGPRPYLLVFDDIEKDDGDHRFEHLLHVPTATTQQVHDAGFELELAHDGRSVSWEFAVLNPGTAEIVCDSFENPGHVPFAKHAMWRVGTLARNPLFVVMARAGGGAQKATVELNDECVTIRVATSGGSRDRIAIPRGARRWPPEFSRAAGDGGAA
jgi:hypothetical protein